VGDQRVDPGEFMENQQRHVAVAPELAQDGLRVPQHQMWHVGPGKGRVPGEKRSALNPGGGMLGRAARQLRGAVHFR